MAKLPLAKAEQLVRRAIGVILERRDGVIAQSILDLETRVARLEAKVRNPEPATQDPETASVPVAAPSVEPEH